MKNQELLRYESLKENQSVSVCGIKFVVRKHHYFKYWWLSTGKNKYISPFDIVKIEDSLKFCQVRDEKCSKGHTFPYHSTVDSLLRTVNDLNHLYFHQSIAKEVKEDSFFADVNVVATGFVPYETAEKFYVKSICLDAQDLDMQARPEEHYICYDKRVMCFPKFWETKSITVPVRVLEKIRIPLITRIYKKCYYENRLFGYKDIHQAQKHCDLLNEAERLKR